MNIWISIIIAGVINYLSRLGSVLLIKPERLNENTKKEYKIYDTNDSSTLITKELILQIIKIS